MDCIASVIRNLVLLIYNFSRVFKTFLGQFLCAKIMQVLTEPGSKVMMLLKVNLWIKRYPGISLPAIKLCSTREGDERNGQTVRTTRRLLPRDFHTTCMSCLIASTDVMRFCWKLIHQNNILYLFTYKMNR